MSSFKNLSAIAVIALAASMGTDGGNRSVLAAPPQETNIPVIPGETPQPLDIEEFLNRHSSALESEMGGDFFQRVDDADQAADPSEGNPVPDPQAIPADKELIPEPTSTVNPEPLPLPQGNEKEITTDMYSESKLPTFSGIPERNGMTGNYAHAGANAPSLRRDIPVEAYGEDGFGNPYVNVNEGFGVPRTGYTGSFEAIRLYSNSRYGYDPSILRAGAFFVSGSVSAGGASDKSWQISPSIGTGEAGDINDKFSEFGMDQLYLSFGKEVERGDSWSFGAQADLLYGTDYIWASSLGLESDKDGFSGGRATRVSNALPHWNKNELGGYTSYGLAMPQAYGEIYAPWLYGFDLKLGHFYAPMGHEAVQSSKNFFYTHSYSFSYGMPHTFTGLLGDLKVTRSLDLQAGFSQGWDTWADNKGHLDVMAGVAVQVNPFSSLSFFVNNGSAVVDNTFDPTSKEFISSVTGNRTNYSLVYQRKCFENVSWAIEHDFGVAEKAAMTMDADGNVHHKSGDWYSLVNYIYYDITPAMTLGFRFEWFKDCNYTRTIGDYAVNELAGYRWDGNNFYDFSLGLNWHILENLSIRPEVRYDYADARMVSLDGTEVSGGVFDDFTKSNMWTVGGDVVFEF